MTNQINLRISIKVGVIFPVLISKITLHNTWKVNYFSNSTNLLSSAN